MIRAEVGMAEEKHDEIQRFAVGGTWSGDGKGCGEIRTSMAEVRIPIGGSKDLGGCGLGANPEELLLASVASCFLNTWAIFIKKLQISYAEPAVRVTGELGKDPAGGFRMLSAKVHARVPASLLAENRAQLEKTLQLTEKYCITSKVARAAMALEVVIEEV
jgi:organic hydroperoxide reductase OsmC/OhrA